MKIHITKQGDSLEIIANKYSVSKQDLIGINSHINPSSSLIPGLKLKIPENAIRKDLPNQDHIQKYYPNIDTFGIPITNQQIPSAIPIGLKPFPNSIMDNKEESSSLKENKTSNIAQSQSLKEENKSNDKINAHNTTPPTWNNWNEFSTNESFNQQGTQTPWQPYQHFFQNFSPQHQDARFFPGLVIPPIFPYPYYGYGWAYPMFGWGYGRPHWHHRNTNSADQRESALLTPPHPYCYNWSFPMFG